VGNNGYVEKLEDLIKNDNFYNLFRENYREVAQRLDNLARKRINEEQLEDLDTDLQTQELKAIMDQYSFLGVITSEEERKFGPNDERYQVTVYRWPERHGNGFSESWEELTDCLEEDMKTVERRKCWEQLEENIEEENHY